MDNGVKEKGCSKSNSCSLLHPKMCPESLESRTCSKMTDGARCNRGYHVKGTKAKSPGLSLGDQNITKATATDKPAVLEPTNTEKKNKPLDATSLVAFLGVCLREEFALIRKELGLTGPQSPQSHSLIGGLAPRETRETVQSVQAPSTTLGSLGNFLSLLAVH